MKAIPLTQGYVALVDDEDYEELSRFKWHAHRNRNTVYAERAAYINRKKITVSMHRTLLGDAAFQLEVDHRDGNGVNNCRNNLRVCTRSENQHNQRNRKNSPTGFKGVSAITLKAGIAYQATINFKQKIRYLGCFKTAEAAHTAYCEAAKQLHGEFARFE